jgi:cytochrome c oxidase subunit III
VRMRAALDLVELPEQAVDAREPIWWGNLLMVTIEGTMFAMTIATYFYLRLLEPEWPPPGVEVPDLPIPTGTLAVLLALVVPLRVMDRAALVGDVRRMRWGIHACLALGLLAMYSRAWEFVEQDVRWDDNAYGSIVWTMLGLHAGHLLANWGETAFLAAVAWRRNLEDAHHRLDLRVLVVYWYFVVGSWVALYAVLYLSPRWLTGLDLGGGG